MADSNVVALPGFSVPNNDVVTEVVDLLEEALEQARSGKLVGIALVAVERDPMCFETRFFGAGQSKHTMAAGALSLGWQIGRNLSEADNG
jgi:hypothetical protein